MGSKITIRFLLLSTLVLAFITVKAQQESYDAAIKAISKYDGSKVKLRWAPDEPHAWQTLNKQGYLIERYTVVFDGKPVKGLPVKKMLTPTPIKVWPEEKWEQESRKNKHVAVAWQALSGDVQATLGKPGGMEQITDVNDISQSSYSLALYVADIEPLASKGLGLSFTDEAVAPNSQYTYVIKPAGTTDENYKINEATISVETRKAFILPAIEDIRVINGDRKIQIAVDISIIKNFYTAYEVEKKEERINKFKRLEKPMQVHLDPKGKPLNWMEVTDSVSTNEKPVWYRLRGVDAFGDKGPYSEEIRAQGRDMFEGGLAPLIDTLINKNGRMVELKWSFPQKGVTKKLQVMRASSIQGPYEVMQILEDPPENGNYKDNDLLMSNYYKVVAYDAAGRKAESYPRLAQGVP